MSIRLRRRSIAGGSSYYWLEAPSVGTWGFASLYDDRYLYAVPVGGTNYKVLKIDTQTDTITEFSTGQSDLYSSSAVTGTTLYATPTSGTTILTIDLTTDTVGTLAAPTANTWANLVTAPNADVWGFPSNSNTGLLKISAGVASSVAITGTNVTILAALLDGTDIYTVGSSTASSNPGVVVVDTTTSTPTRISPTGGTGNRFYGSLAKVGSTIYALPEGATSNSLNGAMAISAGAAAIDSYDYTSNSSFSWAVAANGDVWAMATDGDAKAVQLDVSAGTFDEIGAESDPSSGGVLIGSKVFITLASTRDLRVIDTTAATLSTFASAAVPSWVSGGTSGSFHPVVANGKLYAFTAAGNSVRRLKL